MCESAFSILEITKKTKKKKKSTLKVFKNELRVKLSTIRSRIETHVQFVNHKQQTD